MFKLLAEKGKDEADQWIIIESLCLGIGKLHGRSARATAIFVETIAERIATGERQ